jgi:hypothetical protein
MVMLALSIVLTACFFPAMAAQAAVGQVPAVQWQIVLGAGSARSVQQTADGGYLVAGWTPGNSAGSPTASIPQPGAGSEILVIKTDGHGRKAWERLLPGNGYGTGYDVIQTSDGGAVVVGDTKSKTGTDHDVFVAKLDARGNEVWEKNYGGPRCDYGAAVLQTGDGGYLVAGGTESFGADMYKVYLVKLDALGREIWQQTYGDGGPEVGYALLQAPDGGYVIAGDTESLNSGLSSFCLIRVDNQGRLVWERMYGDSRDSSAWSLLQTGDGYLIAGETEVTGASGGGSKGYAIATDAQGREIRERIYGGDHYGVVYTAWPGAGGYLLAGERDAAQGGYFLNITLTAANGGEESDLTLTGLGDSIAYAGQPTRDGGEIVAGEQGAASGGGQKILLVKLAPDNSAAIAAQSITIIVIIPILVLLAYLRRKHLL